MNTFFLRKAWRFSPHVSRFQTSFRGKCLRKTGFWRAFSRFSFYLNRGKLSCKRAERKLNGAVADMPRFILRTNFPSGVRLSSKGRFPLTSCPGFGARESRICHRPPFWLQIRDSCGVRLTFCKMTNVGGMRGHSAPCSVWNLWTSCRKVFFVHLSCKTQK